ncbi:MAG: sigma-70 family RNA polymerase sigma factor [Spirochaetaceae bacterium]|nr:MAG: sigma-70 family RNA polymerase sigma factor [Spirochaetaceae bacterium]
MTSESRKNADAEDLWAVQATLNGNPAAFEGIVERYTPLLYSLAYRLLAYGEEPEDAVQEILEKVFRSLPRFRISQRFFPWMYTIGLNHLRSLARRGRRRSRLKIRTAEPQRLLESVASEQGNPERQSEMQEGERLAQQALDTLRIEYREVFVLRQIQGFSVREVAEVLQIPAGTVKTYLHRARKGMIDYLSGRGWE